MCNIILYHLPAKELEMKFISTRDKNRVVSFKEAVFQGLSPEGGLFVPNSVPNLSTFYAGLTPKTPFNDMAIELTSLVLKDDISKESAARIINRAYNFKPELVDTGNGIFIEELFHGPSSAFKDFGACFLASSMEEFLQQENRRAIILTATSGDTGSAVAQAFFDKKNIDVVILYPSGRVSPLQEKQLTTLGKNVRALEVKGSFDDCQRMVKQIFTSPDMKYLPLTSANSINLGRLFPQSFYYMYAYSQLKERYKNIVFCVPSGNFGNLTAGVLDWTWGMPVKEFIAATNRNNEVPMYLESGKYEPHPSFKTYSNAMDVGDPSNFERLRFIFKDDYKKMGKMIKGAWVSDEDTLKEISQFYEEKNMFIDPHTAVGYVASKRYMEANKPEDTAVVSLSTAHPGKFLEVVEKATGARPKLPQNLERLLKLEKHSTVIENTDAALKDYLKAAF